jgi:hypothetical protein
MQREAKPKEVTPNSEGNSLATSRGGASLQLRRVRRSWHFARRTAPSVIVRTDIASLPPYVGADARPDWKKLDNCGSARTLPWYTARSYEVSSAGALASSSPRAFGFAGMNRSRCGEGVPAQLVPLLLPALVRLPFAGSPRSPRICTSL